MKKLRIGVEGWLFLFMIALGAIVGQEREWLWILPAVLLHEGGHYLLAFICGVEVKGFRLSLLGVRMDISGILSYRKEFLIAAGGPLANLLSAIIAYAILQKGFLSFGEGATLFLYASIGLGGLNLLPVGTMDGGRMLTALLSGLLSPRVARLCLAATTILCLVSLWLVSAYALLRGAPMMSLFVFSFSLILRYASPDGAPREV